jgi:hypothetical protein
MYDRNHDSNGWVTVPQTTTNGTSYVVGNVTQLSSSGYYQGFYYTMPWPPVQIREKYQLALEILKCKGASEELKRKAAKILAEGLD